MIYCKMLWYDSLLIITNLKKRDEVQGKSVMSGNVANTSRKPGNIVLRLNVSVFESSVSPRHKYVTMKKTRLGRILNARRRPKLTDSIIVVIAYVTRSLYIKGGHVRYTRTA